MRKPKPIQSKQTRSRFDGTDTIVVVVVAVVVVHFIGGKVLILSFGPWLEVAQTHNSITGRIKEQQMAMGTGTGIAIEIGIEIGIGIGIEVCHSNGFYCNAFELQ